MGMVRVVVSALISATIVHVCTLSSPWGTAEAKSKATPEERTAAIQRAQVWMPTDVAAANILQGPADERAFPFRATIFCDYSPKELSGGSPKIACRAGEDELKVKYGGNNAEVYAEVAATRLLWALGFGADRMYPVRVICHGCPEVVGGIARDNDERVLDPAAVERKMPGREFHGDSSWSWTELESVREDLGGAPRAHRDALKLLAVFLQHTDTKPQQQRIMCLDSAASAPAEKPMRCEKPFLMINDLGLTFGKANTFNTNAKGMNLVEWAATPIWRKDPGCLGNLPKSYTGTLNNPVISEDGRAFLADLLMQLTDDQIRAIFQVARADLRLRDPLKARSGAATIDEWVDVFKRKRAEIVDRSCA